MPSNELRARLVGHAMPWGEEMVFSNRENGKHKSWMESPMPYDSDRNACAELLEYVKKEGRVAHFINALSQQFYGRDHADDLNPFGVMHFMTATPAQICAAFDATFAKELAELESKDGK